MKLQVKNLVFITYEEEVGELLRKIRLSEPKSTYLKDLTPQSVADAIHEGKCKNSVEF